MLPEDRATLDYVKRIATENQLRIGAARTEIGSARAEIAALAKVVAADKDIDPAQLAAMVDSAVAKYTPTAAQNAAAIQPALAEVMREVVTDEQADEILRKLGEKLAAAEGN